MGAKGGEKKYDRLQLKRMMVDIVPFLLRLRTLAAYIFVERRKHPASEFLI